MGGGGLLWFCSYRSGENVIFFVIKKSEVTRARELALSRKAECDSASASSRLARRPQPWFLKPNGPAASWINPVPCPRQPLTAPSRPAQRAFLMDTEPWTRGYAVRAQASLLVPCL